jgi:large repetitive protein
MRTTYNSYLRFIILLLILTSSTKFYAQCNADAGPNVVLCSGESEILGDTPSASGDAPFTYSWSPATGLSCTDCPNPVCTATTSTVYTLTITDDDGCTDSDNVSVTVAPNPVAAFTFSPNNGCSNVPVQFTNTSTGSGLSYAWNFNDPGPGNNSSQTNPTHEFDSNGNGSQSYNVRLIATNSFGCKDTVFQTVTVAQSPGPELTDPLTSFKNCDGSNFNMTVYDITANPGNNYTIIWGDGSPNYNSPTPPSGGVTHLYTVADIFDMTYIVTGANGCTDSITYLVSNITNPAIGAANPGATTGCGPITLCFPLSNYAANHVSTYYTVNYGDGSPIDTLPHPPPAVICHTYSTTSCGQPGNAFTFTMKAINSCDSSLASISPIRVYTGPQSNFTPIPEIQCVNVPVTFTNQSVPGYNSSCSNSTIYNWNFGDGQTLTTITMTNPTHIYTLPGTYTVTLSTQNACGTTTHTETVCIEAPPVPNFVLDPDTACIPFVGVVNNLSLTANTCDVDTTWSVIYNGSTCLPSSGTWAYTNGTSATSIEPEFLFSGAGQYTVRLTMNNSCGNFFYDQIVIGQAPPQISMAALPTICAGESVSPTATINNCYELVDSYAWTFTGGTPVNSILPVPGSVTYSAAGNYTVQLQVANVCGIVNASTPVTVLAPPTANAGPDLSFCSGGNGVLGIAPVGGVTYNWTPVIGLSSSAVSNPTITLINATASPVQHEYVLTASSSPTCFTRDTVEVTVNPIPVLNVNSPAICFGETTSLLVTGAEPSGSYSWTASPDLSCTNCNNPSTAPSITTSYSVTGTNSYNCSSSISSTVTVNPLPIVNAGPDLTLCDQPIAETLNGSPIGGSWTGSANLTSGGIFTPNGPEIASLVYTYTDPVTNCENSDTMVITINPAIIPVIDPLDSLCVNLTVVDLLTNLNASPAGGTFSGPGVSGNTINPSLAGIGTHQIIYNYGTGTCASADTAIIRVDPQPTITTNSETICFGDTTSLLADGAGINGTYSWSPSTSLSCSNCADPLAFPGTTTIYTIIGTNSFGCSNSTTSTVTVNPLPIVSAGPDFVLCDQPVAELLNGTPAGGIWNGSINVTSGGIFTPNGSEISQLVYSFTDAGTGCQQEDTMQVTVSPAITPAVDPTISVCSNDPILNLNTALNPNPLGGIWSGAGITNPNFNAASAGVGTHIVTYTYGSGTCQTFATVDITVNPQPTVTVNSGTICFGDSLALLVTGADTYTWSNGATLSCTNCDDPFASPTSTSSYTVTGTTVLGCSNSAIANLSVNPLPIVNAGPDQILCDQPLPVTLIGTPSGGTWSGSLNVSTSGIFTPNGSEVSTLYYTYIDPTTLCENVDSMVVTVNPPIIPIVDPSYSICVYESAINLNTALNASPLGGTWSGTGVSNPNFSPSIAGVGTHTVTYTYGVGTCQTSVTSDITVNPQPTISVNSETICSGDNILLIASGAGVSGTYSWTPASNLSCSNCDSPTADPTITTVYTVTGTTQFGCQNTANSTVSVNPLPIANAGPDTTLCNLPSTVQFTGTQAGGVWSGLNIDASGLFTPSGTGTFTITYTVSLGTGCVNSDSRVVTVIDPVPANAGQDEEICIGSPNFILPMNPVGGIWTGTNVGSTGIFSPIIDGTFPLVYSVGAGNCLTRDTMIFVVHPLPMVNAGNDQDFCATDTAINFNGTPIGGNWTGTGIVYATNGTFDPVAAGVGLHEIVYTYVNPITTCLNRDTLYADVHPLPMVDFSFNPIVCEGATETFTNNSTLVNASNWNFGDGNTSSVLSPDHVYSNTGFYDIELIITTAFGCMDSLTQQIEVREPPFADFSVLPDSACGPMTVAFTNNSSGISVSYAWDFGNGQTSALEDPAAVTYFAGMLADTTYTIQLDVTNFCGTVTHTEDVIVMPTPTAIFGSDFNSGCSPFTANFASTSLGLPDSYYWDFGNGVTSATTDSLFQQTFTTGSTPTDYTIMLVVMNECGQDTAYHTITALPNTVNAFFNTSATTSCFDLTVNFTQYTLGGTLWSWDFGDGTTSSEYSPTHVYPAPGVYNVSLFANDGCSFDTTTVAITVNEPPAIGFTFTPDSSCINVPISFINFSGPDVASSWDFGDGNTSNVTNPVHQYAASGNYTVTLTGTSLINGCQSTISQVLNVSENPVAQFTPNPSSGCVALGVQFNNNSTNAQYYTWNFGDGNTSGLANPNHTFNQPGAYTVQLIAENVNGCSDTTQQIITVHPLPITAFTSTYNCTDPVTIQFSNNSSGAVGYSWDFGNGQTSTLNNPLITYSVPGNYNVSLTAVNQYGCEHEVTQTITVYPLPEISIVLPVAEICAGEEIIITPIASDVDSIVWNLGNGVTFSGDLLTYTYPNSGNYYISATAYGGSGCTSTVSASSVLTVNEAAIADFDYEHVETNGGTDGTIVFTNLSQNADSYFWTFGDGNSSNQVNPTHEFIGSVDYTTTLYAFNESGCNDSITINVDINFFNGLFLPNAIYPGHENFEISHFIPKGVGLKEFELLIYDDWGNLIWETSALDAQGRPTESWDGTFNGQPVQQDSYVWKVTAIFIDESAWEGKEYKEGKFRKAGTVTVIR